MTPQTNATPSPFARTDYFPAAPAPWTPAWPSTEPALHASLPWWANGWLTKGFALMAGMIVMGALVFVSSLRAEQEQEGHGRSATTKSGIVSGRTTNAPRNARDAKSPPRPRAGSTKSGVID